MRTEVYSQFFALEETHWWFRAMRALQWQVLREHGLPRGRVLDLGCGTGLWLRELSAETLADGCDLSPEALAFCRERGLPRLVRASATDLPYRDGAYDLVTALGLVEHVADDVGMLREVHRVLAPGGHLLLLTSGHPSLWSEHDEAVHHQRRYTRGELRGKLEEAGFAVERLTHANLALTLPALAVRALRAVVPAARGEGYGTPDLFELPTPVNQLLYWALRSEGALIRAVDLPAGLGILALARRRGGGSP